MKPCIRFVSLSACAVALVAAQLSAAQRSSVKQLPASQLATGHTWKLKRAALKQRTGWEAMPQYGIAAKPIRTLDALTMLIPTDWQFNGGQDDPKAPKDCNGNLGRLHFQTGATDNSAGIIVLPGTVSLWSNDRALLAAVRRKSETSPEKCVIEQPVSLEADMQKGIAMFKGEPTGPLQPIPGTSDKLAADVQRANQQIAEAANGRRPGTIQAQAGRVPFRFNAGGKPMDGLLSVLVVHRTDYLPNGAMVQTTDQPLISIYFAEPGRLPSLLHMFDAMMDSVTINPEYTADNEEAMQNIARMNRETDARIAQQDQSAQAQIAGIQRQIAADNINTANKIAGIHRDSANYAANVTSSVARNRSSALEHSSQQFALHMGDQAIYKDPATGQRVQLSNQYSHAYSNPGTNEIILTDSPTYNPGPQWNQMQAER